MHITKQVRALLVKKCGLVFNKMVSEAVFFNYIRNLEEYMNQHIKKSLYEVVDIAGESDENRHDGSHTIFYKWFRGATNNIEKDDNKGRKLVRKVKGLQTKYTDNLPYGIGVGSTITTLYSLFLMSKREEQAFVETYGVASEHKIIKEYLIGLLVIEEVEEAEQELNLIDLMLLGEGNAIFNGINFIGQKVLNKD